MKNAGWNQKPFARDKLEGIAITDVGRLKGKRCFARKNIKKFWVVMEMSPQLSSFLHVRELHLFSDWESMHVAVESRGDGSSFVFLVILLWQVLKNHAGNHLASLITSYGLIVKLPK